MLMVGRCLYSFHSLLQPNSQLAKYKITSTLLKNMLHLCPEYFAIKHTLSVSIMNTNYHESSSSMWHSHCCHKAQKSFNVCIYCQNEHNKQNTVSSFFIYNMFQPSSSGRTVTIYMEMHTEVEVYPSQ
jgi:hypothetical protein